MKLAEITRKYINQPYDEYGCVELVVAVMADMGYALPGEIDGINVKNYKDLVTADIKKAQITLLKTFRKIGRPTSTKYPWIGDLLVVYQKHRQGLFPAVSVGNGQAMASFIRYGVQVFRLDRLNLPIMARRIR